MTGREDELLPEGVPAFGDPTYDDLRAELAGLEPVGPMPAAVAARLDDVLAGLGGEPAVPPEEPVASEPAAPLGDPVVVPVRRRSHAGRRLLVAAAAVVAVGGGGIGLANVVQTGSDDADKDSSVAAADSAKVPEATAGRDGAGADGEALADGLGSGFAATTTPQLRADRFAADASALLGGDPMLAQQLRRVEGTAPNAPSPEITTPQKAPATADRSDDDTEGDESGGVPDGATTSLNNLRAAAQRCATDRITGGVARPILLDDVPAILVVYPAVSGTRVVQARSCDASTVLISVTVPAT